MILKIALFFLFFNFNTTKASSCNLDGSGRGCRIVSVLPTGMRVNEDGNIFKFFLQVTLKNISPTESQKVQVKITDFKFGAGVSLKSCEPRLIKCGYGPADCNPTTFEPEVTECRPMYYCPANDGDPLPDDFPKTNAVGGGLPLAGLTDICDEPCRKTKLKNCREVNGLVRKAKLAHFTEYWSSNTPILVAGKDITRSTNLSSFAATTRGDSSIIYTASWKQSPNIHNYFSTSADFFDPIKRETINFAPFNILPNTTQTVSMILYCGMFKDNVKCYFNPAQAGVPGGSKVGLIPLCSSSNTTPEPCLLSAHVGATAAAEVHVYNDRGAILGSWQFAVSSGDENESGSIPLNGGRPF